MREAIDYNFGTLIRANCEEDYTQENSIFGPSSPSFRLLRLASRLTNFRLNRLPSPVLRYRDCPQPKRLERQGLGAGAEAVRGGASNWAVRGDSSIESKPSHIVRSGTSRHCAPGSLRRLRTGLQGEEEAAEQRLKGRRS
jgi:hypothetical protein